MRHEFNEQEVIDIIAAYAEIKKGRGRFEIVDGKFYVIIESEADVLPFLRPVDD